MVCGGLDSDPVKDTIKESLISYCLILLISSKEKKLNYTLYKAIVMSTNHHG